jgi:hypothetical protein
MYRMLAASAANRLQRSGELMLPPELLGGWLIGKCGKKNFKM